LRREWKVGGFLVMVKNMNHEGHEGKPEIEAFVILRVLGG
jgi:hypothetical protein